MSDNFEKTNTSDQTTNHDENEKDEILTFNCQPTSGMVPLSDITENNLVVVDHATIFDNFNTETIVLHKMNISYEDIVKTFKEKFMIKIEDGKYVMSNKDAINLAKLIGLPRIAMSESEKNNKQLRTRNSILQNKYENYDCVVQECSWLKSEIDKIKINLCIALGRRFNDKEDVMHLINVCAALAARENEYNYLLTENYRLKYVLNNQLMDIHAKTLNNYDEILQSVENLKEELYIRDLKISQLKDEILLESPEEFIDQNFQAAFDYSQNNKELYEGKMLIVEQIIKIQESSDFKSENHQLCDLINILTRLTAENEVNLKTNHRSLIKNIENKNQQKIKEIDDLKKSTNNLENENKRLNSEIKNIERVQKIYIDIEYALNNLKKDYSEMKLMCDKLNKKETHLLALLENYQQRLTDKEIKYVDDNHLIKTLETNLIEQKNKFELVNAKYNKAKEKCQINETYTQQMLDGLKGCLREKEIDLTLLRKECSDLKHQYELKKNITVNLKHKVIQLGYVLKEKNKTIQDMLKAQSKKQQQYTATSRPASLLSDNQLHIDGKLEQQLDILLDSFCTWTNIIVGYEKVLYNMQEAFQQQSMKRNYCIAKNQKLTEYKAMLTENLTKEKKVILLQHNNEMESIKEKYNLKIAHMTDEEVNLRNEIRDLKENAKQKSSSIMTDEKILSLQLIESRTTIQELTYISNIQSIKLNDIKNGIPEKCCDIRLSKTSKNRFQQMENLVDYTLKLKSENELMEKLLKIRNEKIKSQDNCRCICTRTSIMK